MAYVSDGDKMPYTPTTGVTVGDAIAVGSVVGVADRPIPANTLGALAVCGVFSVAKPTGSGTDYAQGAKVSLFGGQAVTGATGTAMGFVWRKPATTDATVDVMLAPGADARAADNGTLLAAATAAARSPARTGRSD